MALLCALLSRPVATSPNIDGGRSDLPGMKQDIFDQVNKRKNQGPQRQGRGPPDCPKSDKMSPFVSMAFADGGVYVRINSSEGKCYRLVSVGGANFSVLENASKTCGPAGEWKKRIAEEMSAVFFQGGLEWVKSENETIEVETEEGIIEAEVSEAKWLEMESCWRKSCDCEQSKNPKMRLVLIALFVIAAGGLSYDSLKLAYETLKGKKPPKNVQCKKGHKMSESNYASNHLCDICGKSGTSYQCHEKCNYDLCKDCYKKKKKEVKAKFKEYLEKHPEDPDNKKKEKEVDEDDDEKKKADSQSEAGDNKARVRVCPKESVQVPLSDTKSDAEKSEAESGEAAAETGEAEAAGETDKAEAEAEAAGETDKAEAEAEAEAKAEDGDGEDGK